MKLSCPDCGAEIKFSPKFQKCYCEHCGEAKEINKLNYDINKSEYVSVDCDSCGAKLLMSETDLIVECIYCGSNNLIVSRLQEKFLPDGILPFQIGKEQIYEYYINFVKKHNHFPKEFVNNPKLESIKGVYVPYGLFKWKYKLYTKKNKFEHEVVIPKDLGKKFDDSIMKFLEPFDNKKILKFHPAYLSGFYAEKSDADVIDADLECGRKVRRIINDSELYQNEIEEIEKENLNNRVEEIQFDLFKEKNEIVLLPVWFFNEKYNGNTYFYAINGETGSIACKFWNENKYKIVFDNKNKRFHKDSPEKIKKYEYILLKFREKLVNVLAIILLLLIIIGVPYFITLGASGIDKIYGIALMEALILPVFLPILIILLRKLLGK